MKDEDVAWAAGAFSAYGIAERRGKKPSLMIRGFTSEVPKRMVETLKLGRMEGGVMPKWVCDEPDEVAAFFKRVGPAIIASRRDMIEQVWAGWRVWMQEKKSEDPGEIEDYGHAEVQEARAKVWPVWGFDSSDPETEGKVERWVE